MSEQRREMQTTELTELPSITRLLLQAVTPVRGRPRPEDGPPPERFEVKDYRQDAERLAAYARVCRLTLRDHVPPTWLHVLTFPLQMCVMASPKFPFGLSKTLHVSNDMSLLRPVNFQERLDLSVECTTMTPHRKGVAFDLVGEARSGGELVWRGTSAYVAEVPMAGDPVPSLRLDAPDVEFSQLWRLPGDMGRQYAAVSGDYNPIHLNRLTARTLGMKRPIVHGMWTYARSLAAVEGRLPAAYRSQVQFTKPLALPGTARFGVAEEADRMRFLVANSDGTKPYLVGEVTPVS